MTASNIAFLPYLTQTFFYLFRGRFRLTRNILSQILHFASTSAVFWETIIHAHSSPSLNRFTFLDGGQAQTHSLLPQNVATDSVQTFE